MRDGIRITLYVLGGGLLGFLAGVLAFDLLAGYGSPEDRDFPIVSILETLAPLVTAAVGGAIGYRQARPKAELGDAR